MGTAISRGLFSEPSRRFRSNGSRIARYARPTSARLDLPEPIAASDTASPAGECFPISYASGGSGSYLTS